MRELNSREFSANDDFDELNLNIRLLTQGNTTVMSLKDNNNGTFFTVQTKVAMTLKTPDRRGRKLAAADLFANEYIKESLISAFVNATGAPEVDTFVNSIEDAADADATTTTTDTASTSAATDAVAALRMLDDSSNNFGSNWANLNDRVVVNSVRRLGEDAVVVTFETYYSTEAAAEALKAVVATTNSVYFNNKFEAALTTALA
jgi:hypothetical protein